MPQIISSVIWLLLDYQSNVYKVPPRSVSSLPIRVACLFVDYHPLQPPTQTFLFSAVILLIKAKPKTMTSQVIVLPSEPNSFSASEKSRLVELNVRLQASVNLWGAF